MEVKPFLKWAGGKTQILSQIEENLPKELKEGNIKKYIEPFVGGGAVLFYLLQKYEFKKVIISDINEDLMLCYKVVKNDVDRLIEELSSLRDEFLSLDEEKRKEFYYKVRDDFNKNKNDCDEVKRVAQFIFLNKTCYNGLYRVNKKGEFNVPYGRYKNPKIFDEQNLKNVSKLLKNVKILCGDFEIVDEYVDAESFVYFDPPYKPLNKTSSFTSYTKYDFNDDDQIRLAKFYRKLDKRGAKLMLSNSYNVDFFGKLYEGFNIKKVVAKRMINCKGDKRKDGIYELLIMNY
ncbi:TPA: DNA adenine methylase [Methanocaldococcus jannaschii]|uniref:Type II methyltransferase M.MjaIII n=2 Tax=Methanocaldococcus jannaschii TaxID=2190 RepID=MTM3_METJA|nr:DNA adenine methylase [Methanocaldococcus jannaschii]Q58015.1 RecName: Full=Type II methyltransferase M.MjaIII; Short=M.MjaIII; AltName: Full=Adenine-specific methyltransferase MjaIII [Methanocaldococcus jannaschii DSM 2661]AAB98590.1 modification methylase, type II R/M system 2 [Methanocaldococcus jannaschii DSM 2661]HII59550.1 DNA adenine methylase [Methanocaldococcus jannaschii]